MRLILPPDFVTMPWKNGGGVTHEIARAEDGAGLLWRLSVAEVATDGPFSPFPGLARILTVIAGDGLVLSMRGEETAAAPLSPVAFSGDEPVACRLVAGAVRDFNLIFDPARIAGAVSVLTGPGMAPAAAGPPVHAVFALTAGVVARASAADTGADTGTVAVPPGAAAVGVAGVGAEAPGALALWVNLAAVAGAAERR